MSYRTHVKHRVSSAIAAGLLAALLGVGCVATMARSPTGGGGREDQWIRFSGTVTQQTESEVVLRDAQGTEILVPRGDVLLEGEVIMIAVGARIQVLGDGLNGQLDGPLPPPPPSTNGGGAVARPGDSAFGCAGLVRFRCDNRRVVGFCASLTPCPP